MLFRRPIRVTAFHVLVITLLATLTGCGKSTGSSGLGTYRMGETLHAGPLTYTVLEARWHPALNDAGTGPAPKHRYLFVKLSATNVSGTSESIPALELVAGKDGTTFQEVTEGLAEVPDWLGILRIVPPSKTEQGYAIFDAPVGAYKLLISDGGTAESEKTAQVELPVQLD